MKNRRTPFCRYSLIALIASMAPLVSYAHTGGSETADFWHGMLHPMGGLDHVLAMIAVGIWAAQLGGRAIWLVPATFVGVMATGGSLGMSGNVVLPFVEQSIVLSVLMLGVLIAAAIRLPLPVSATTVGLFAAFHGVAHGVELPMAASAMAYALGFVLATACLHLCGIGLRSLFARLGKRALVRYVGGMIAVGGAYLILA